MNAALKADAGLNARDKTSSTLQKTEPRTLLTRHRTQARRSEWGRGVAKKTMGHSRHPLSTRHNKRRPADKTNIKQNNGAKDKANKQTTHKPQSKEHHCTELSTVPLPQIVLPYFTKISLDSTTSLTEADVRRKTDPST